MVTFAPFAAVLQIILTKLTMQARETPPKMSLEAFPQRTSYQIFQYLHPRSNAYNLALSSKRLNILATTFLY